MSETNRNLEPIDFAAWHSELQQELNHNILGFWMDHTIDEEHGGFIGEMSNDRTTRPDAPKGLVLNARILWTFASAYRLDPQPAYKRMGERAYDALFTSFLDREHGGYYWLLDESGNPLEDKKQVYGQAFVMYAYAEWHRATGALEAMERAIDIYRWLERFAYDHKYKGYFEAKSRDWSDTDNLSLSGKDLNEKKSMNTHLHVLEAYTNLYRIWPSGELRKSLNELIEITIDHIVDPETNHFLLFFDDAWDVKSHIISYGHDIEGSWLLMEAAEALQDEALLERTKRVAIGMAEATLREGWDAEYGGIFYEAEDGRVDDEKHWWPQAEAIVGFYNAYTMTGQETYLQAAYNAWRFADQHLCDRLHGEWFWKTSRSGEPAQAHPKVDPWKCPYHNGRAMMEMIERLQHTTNDAANGGEEQI